eukprot:GFYU01002409.1.p1 GENE.GFYU01002409.1~~GFYU01002409.1.p1  ORF type:complete len:493 (-),score=20.71 GFYU01002409.1:526-2004(-)
MNNLRLRRNSSGRKLERSHSAESVPLPASPVPDVREGSTSSDRDTDDEVVTSSSDSSDERLQLLSPQSAGSVRESSNGVNGRRILPLSRAGPTHLPKRTREMALGRSNSQASTMRTESQESLDVRLAAANAGQCTPRSASVASDCESGCAMSDAPPEDDLDEQGSLRDKPGTLTRASDGSVGRRGSKYTVAVCEHYIRVVETGSLRAKQLQQRVRQDGSSTFQVDVSRVAPWKVRMLNAAFCFYGVLSLMQFWQSTARMFNNTEPRMGDGCFMLHLEDRSKSHGDLHSVWRWFPMLAVIIGTWLLLHSLIPSPDWLWSVSRYQWVFIKRQKLIFLVSSVLIAAAHLMRSYEVPTPRSGDPIIHQWAQLANLLVIPYLDIILMFIGNQRVVQFCLLSLGLVAFHGYVNVYVWNNRCMAELEPLVVRVTRSVDLVSSNAYAFKVLAGYVWTKVKNPRRPWMNLDSERLHTNDADQPVATAVWDHSLTFAVLPSK